MSRPRYWLAGTLVACCLAVAANAQIVSQVVNTVAANALTGTTLASGVTASSLTSTTSASGIFRITNSTLAGDVQIQLGDDISLATPAQSGWVLERFTDGSLYTSMKTIAGGKINFRSGAGAEVGSARTWMIVDPSNGAIGMPLLASSSAAQTGTVCWTTSTGNLTVDTTTTCLASSARFKHDIQPLDIHQSLATVLALRPVSYEYNDPMVKGQQVGFVAEDVAQLDDRLVSREPDGSPHSVRYQQLTADLAGAIQAQQKQIEELRARHWCAAGWCW